MLHIRKIYRFQSVSYTHLDVYKRQHEEYPELLTKQERPYCCLTFYDERGFYICIPYRSNVAQPNNAYMLRTRRNSTRQNPGLDYSKIVIIKEESYIDDAIAVIDTDNYVNTVTHIERIKNCLLYTSRCV